MVEKQLSNVPSNDLDKQRLFEPLFSVIDKNHLKVCPCQQNLVEDRFRLLCDKHLKDLDSEPDYVIESRKKQLYELSLTQIADELPVNSLCPLEVNAMNDNIKMFVNSHYDLNNPVVFGIVKNALSLELSTFRLQLLSKDSDMVVKSVDDNGKIHWVINPAIEASRKSSESVIKAFEILSRVVDGNKNVNVNLDIDVVPFNDLFK